MNYFAKIFDKIIHGSFALLIWIIFWGWEKPL